MNIYLVNESTEPDTSIKSLIPALFVYSRHIRKWWGTMQPGIIFGDPATPNAWQLVFRDTPDEAGYAGYHDVTPDGRPIAYVYTQLGDWHITLAHELAEMLMDPWIMRCEQTGDARFHALELCDPVEGDMFAYTIEAGGRKFHASDFITPLWFVPGAKGQFSHRDHPTEALQVLQDGYAYYWENGQWLSEDHFGTKRTVEEFQELHPEKRRLAQYARPR